MPTPRSADPTRPRVALAQYRHRAQVYDRELAPFEPIREQAIRHLGLRPSDTVLDVGCGTGLSFAALCNGVGPSGRVVGIEQSPEMLEQAQARVAQHGWANVALVGTPVAQAKLPLQADAALFHFTHDVLRQPQAIAHVLQHLRPGARVVASGLKWAGVWTWPVNWLVWPAALYSVSSLEGLQQPWDRLADQLGGMAVDTLWLDAVFVAHGTTPPQGRGVLSLKSQ